METYSRTHHALCSSLPWSHETFMSVGTQADKATSARSSRHQHSPDVRSPATNRNFAGPLSLSFLVGPSCSSSSALLCPHSFTGSPALSFTTQINGPIPPIHPSPAMLAPADASSSEAPPSTLSFYLGILSNQRPAVTITTCFTLSHWCFEATFQHFLGQLASCALTAW